jgi:hypothetical protein
MRRWRARPDNNGGKVLADFAVISAGGKFEYAILADQTLLSKHPLVHLFIQSIIALR